jgi:hypothetical protein
MLDENSVALLEMEEVACPEPITGAVCANCGEIVDKHRIKTPLGFGCLETGCLQCVKVHKQPAYRPLE